MPSAAALVGGHYRYCGTAYTLETVNNLLAVSEIAARRGTLAIDPQQNEVTSAASSYVCFVDDAAEPLVVGVIVAALATGHTASNLINGLVRERAQAAALQLKLDFVWGFGLLPGQGLGLSFQLHPRGVFAISSPFGLLCRDSPRCPARLC